MGDLTEIHTYDISDDEFEAIKKRIEEAQTAKRPVLFRKPKRSSGVLEGDVRAALAQADEAYENGEWIAAAQVYIGLSEMKVGPVSLAAKLALCGATSGDYLVSFSAFKEALEIAPAESDTYLAMAMVKISLALHKQARKWLALSRLAMHRHEALILDAEAECDLLERLSTYLLSIFSFDVTV